MEHLKILYDKENKLLKFREISALAPFSKTPTKSEILKIFAEKYKTTEELCTVKKVKGSFGRKEFLLTMRIYDNKASQDHVEKKKKKEKKKADAASGGKK